MLIIGPIDAGRDTNASGLCDDQGPDGNLETLDYLDDGEGTDEVSLEVVFGDEIAPDFGGAAAGVGVAFAGNPDINPDAAGGVLTVWLAEADANGFIRFDDAANVGALDNYIVYSLAYLENTTGDPLGVTLEVGSDDSIKVLVNGEQVWLSAVCRGIPAYGSGDRVPVTLDPGINTVLIAVVESGGDTAVRLVVRDALDAPLVDGSVLACLGPETATVSTASRSGTRSRMLLGRRRRSGHPQRCGPRDPRLQRRWRKQHRGCGRQPQLPLRERRSARPRRGLRGARGSVRGELPVRAISKGARLLTTE
jgi:hypothetical protein